MDNNDTNLNKDAAENIDTNATNGDELDLKYKDKKEVVKGGAVGAFIGLAIIVPGVSGSVAAIILGLYEKLLYALGNLFKKFKKCAKFLIPIVLGAVLGVVAGFLGVRWLYGLIPFAVVALFAGLMFGSLPAVTGEIKGDKITPLKAILFFLGLLVPIALSAISIFAASDWLSVENLKFYHYLLFVVVGYTVAVTQLVPGLSGTALLMMLGCFNAIIGSVKFSYWGENPYIFIVYVCLAIGFLAGLFTVPKGITALIERHHSHSFFAICGLSIGSAVSMFFNPEIYSVYVEWAQNGFHVWEFVCGIALFVCGVVLAYLFLKYEKKNGKK